MINLRNFRLVKKFWEMKIQKILANIVEKILDFHKPQKGKGLLRNLAKHIKILTPKQMLQRLPIALAQVKEFNTSENVLHEIRQIISYLYLEEEVGIYTTI